MPSPRTSEDVSIVWYVDAQGISWEGAADHELWLMDGDALLLRAGGGMLACALRRPSGAPAA